jgi:hypothetical protein
MGKVCLIIFSPGFRRVRKLRLNVHLLAALVSVVAIVVGTFVAMEYSSFMEIGDSVRLYRVLVENRDLIREKETAESQMARLRSRAIALEQEATRIATELQEEGLELRR